MTQENKIPKKILPFIWQMTKGKRGLLFATLLLTMVGEIIGSSIPYIYKMVIDSIHSPLVSDAYSTVLFWSSVYIISFLCMSLAFRASTFVGNRAILSVVALKTYPFLREYLQKHSHSFYSNNFAGAISAKETQVAEGAYRLLSEAVWSIIATALSLVVTAGFIFGVEMSAGVVFVVLVVVIVLLNIPLFKWQGKLSKIHVTAVSKVKGFAIDALTNMRAVQSFAQSSRESSRLALEYSDTTIKNLRKRDAMVYIALINSIVILLAVAVIVTLLLAGYKQGVITAGDFVLVFALIGGVWRELMRMGTMMNEISNTYSEAQEGMDVIFAEHDVKDNENAPELVAKSGEIVLDDMSFSHESVEVFKDFNLNIKAGERIGLVGKSGAGKSTLVSLLLREYDIAGGAIKIDGANIAEVTQDSLRRTISVVPQEPALFHRSIRENIAYARPDASDEEVRDAAKKAHALEFIDTLPEGMNTLVGERGVKLSGGQRQRIAIARAILKDAPILILDEATSALDSESELAVQKALKELMHGKTVIAIAHRLSTLRDMSRILILEHGTIKEDGTHEELLRNKGTYSTLWNHQAGGFLQEE